MAARLNRRHQDMVREKIRASQLVNRLEDHVSGKVDLTDSQIHAIDVLLTLSLKSGAAPDRLFGARAVSDFADYGVYVIEAVGTNRYKIGYTNNIARRLSCIQTGCPVPISVVTVLPMDQSAETWLHRRFDEYRVCGEWFELPESAIQYLVHISNVEGLSEGRENPTFNGD